MRAAARAASVRCPRNRWKRLRMPWVGAAREQGPRIVRGSAARAAFASRSASSARSRNARSAAAEGGLCSSRQTSTSPSRYAATDRAVPAGAPRQGRAARPPAARRTAAPAPPARPRPVVGAARPLPAPRPAQPPARARSRGRVYNAARAQPYTRGPMSPFQVEKTDGRARAGRLSTPHGVVETPAFMPVGTGGRGEGGDRARPARGRRPDHPGQHLPPHAAAGRRRSWRARGGLHGFTAWNGPFLTDSGGYQVFSLAALRKLTEEGVAFRSHLDGAPHLLSPERSMEIQTQPGRGHRDGVRRVPAVPGAARGRRRSDRAHHALGARAAATPSCASPRATARSGCFGIVQGGVHLDLRERERARDRGARLPRPTPSAASRSASPRPT